MRILIKEILRIPFGETTLPESWIYAGGKKENKIPIIFSVFLIITRDKKILVDAGCETMPGFEMRNFTTPMLALKERGIDPGEITDVIITHAHHDHIQCVRYFENARVHIQKEERDRGEKYLAGHTQISVFETEKEITEGVKLVKIGGHSPGSCVVECHMDGQIFVLCGDECYCRYNLENRIPTASSCCPENSRAFIEKYAKDPYCCLLCHDPK